MEGRLQCICVTVVLLLLFAPRQVLGQDKTVEAQALALQKKAMEDDYLNVDLDKAIEKLGEAVNQCGLDKCSANLRALLRRDLAVVYTTANKRADAIAR